jgi:hypothetical protein
VCVCVNIDGTLSTGTVYRVCMYVYIYISYVCVCVYGQDPLDWDCLSNLAKLAYTKGDLEHAKDLFERAVAIRPERDKTV